MSYFGDVELAASSSLGEIVLAHHRSRSCLDPHDHESAYLSICMDGAYDEQFAGGSDEVRRGDLFVHPAREGHGNDIGGGGATILNLRICVPLQRLYWVDAIHAARRRLHCTESLLGSLERLVSTCHRHDSALELLGAAEIVLPELAAGERPTPADAQLRAAAAAAEAEPAETWSLANMAAVAGYHRVYFAQKFRNEFGCTPGEFVRRLRVRKAVWLMSIEHCSATEAAHASGFFDSAHMTNTFRKMMATTPTALTRQESPRGH